jgi:hypothetical protein
MRFRPRDTNEELKARLNSCGFCRRPARSKDPPGAARRDGAGQVSLAGPAPWQSQDSVLTGGGAALLRQVEATGHGGAWGYRPTWATDRMNPISPIWGQRASGSPLRGSAVRRRRPRTGTAAGCRCHRAARTRPRPRSRGRPGAAWRSGGRPSCPPCPGRASPRVRRRAGSAPGTRRRRRRGRGRPAGGSCRCRPGRPGRRSRRRGSTRAMPGSREVARGTEL